MSSSDSPDFAKGIFEQFDSALRAGVSKVTANIPVVSLESNRITLGAPAKKLDKSPHTITLRKHPSRVIRVEMTSNYGLACPDPMPAVGLTCADLPEDYISGPNVNRYAGFLILSSMTDCRLLGTGFDEETYAPVSGVNEECRNLFVAQVAGIATREATRIIHETAVQQAEQLEHANA